VKGDQISFGDILSTKKACTERAANEQESTYLAALGSAVKFTLASNALKIYYGDGNKALNFVGNSPAAVTSSQDEECDGAVALLTSFYEAINAKDYKRAYALWETGPRTFRDFASGYETTAKVEVFAQQPAAIEGAAGSLYAEIPTILISHGPDNREKLFAGCYVMRKSNLPQSSARNSWRIYRATVYPVNNASRLANTLARACQK
jgi:hypothetical protein